MQPETKTEEFIIPIGPQHPALKEPGHFEFGVDGETITSASVRLGYVHRGIEKGAEGRNWAQNLYLVERVCGICSHTHATVYALTVEKLAGIEAPPRAQAIRELVLELERVHSHLLWLGVVGHEGGFDTLFMYSWRDREIVMDLLEALTGNRVNYSTNVLGGVKHDVSPAQADAIRKGIDTLEERTHHYLNVVMVDSSFIGRTKGVGYMTKEQANALGAVGPTARASGVARDLRINAPYAAYPQYPVEMITDTGGDVFARTVVRVKELFECYRVIRQILDTLPAGDLTVKFPRKVKEGEALVRVEAPRGELMYYIKSAGGENPERVKIRTPTLANWGTVLTTVVGHKLADVPMILGGIDPCFSCNDRMITVQPATGAERHWTWEQLRRYGIAQYAGDR
jgi:NADH-quinone oxidoreductase subunit D